MTEEHLRFAYILAVSAVPTEVLCDEGTFATELPGQTFTWMDRERIGSEAAAIRGDERYDWVETGKEVLFYTDEFYHRQTGVVQAFEVERTYGDVYVFVRILRAGTRRTFRVPIQNCRALRNQNA